MAFQLGSCADVTCLGRLEAVETFLSLYIFLDYLANTHSIWRRYCWVKGGALGDLYRLGYLYHSIQDKVRL